MRSIRVIEEAPVYESMGFILENGGATVLISECAQNI